MNDARIAVICGGSNEEREVSLSTGKAVAEALRVNFEVDVFEIKSDELPPGLDPERHVVFPALHGSFGEDGGLQNLLEDAGIAYAGTGPEGSRLCFAKQETKNAVLAAGVRVAPGMLFTLPCPFPEGETFRALAPSFFLKPDRQGSSVGLSEVVGVEQLRLLWGELKPGEWLLEKRIMGREITVGMLNGKDLGLVEIRPRGGSYDYRHKYTKGLTEYLFPAKINGVVENEIRAAARAAYTVCDCRDFARIDFMLNAEEESFFLEINTLPGLTATSLLPMSASCNGINFPKLVGEMVAPALRRFQPLEAIIKS